MAKDTKFTDLVNEKIRSTIKIIAVLFFFSTLASLYPQNKIFIEQLELIKNALKILAFIGSIVFCLYVVEWVRDNL